MNEVQDFALELNSICERLAVEQNTRKADDQEIIDVLNEVCFKMCKSF